MNAEREQGKFSHLDCGELAIWTRVWSLCRSRITGWRTPPKWTRDDWHEEIRAHCAVVAWQAIREFDRDRGPSLENFVRRRVLLAALARYRREWWEALHTAADVDTTRIASAGEHSDVISDQEVHQAIRQLPESDQSLLDRLFRHGESESTVALDHGLSQQAVNKRKQAILGRLRKLLSESEVEFVF